MTERMYLLDESGNPEPLLEAPYVSEDALQALIAEHPELLAGEQMTPEEPRRWILITREMGIANSADTGSRWAVDHLLLDQDARPTLVEVKRGANPEIKRTVIGQMLEYAAHAKRSWSADLIRARFESEQELQGIDPLVTLSSLLRVDGEPDADAYWESVSTNLRAGNLRLLFVADELPDELIHVVEFLNEHMPDIDVLAVEVKQFQGESFRTLVPRVFGRTAKRRPGGAGRPPMTLERFLPQFREGSIRDAARRLLDRSAAAGASFEWGSRGVSIRGHCRLWPQPLTVAWLYPSEVGWMRTRHFSFGSGVVDADLPPELRELLVRYADGFRSYPFVRDASSEGVSAWSVEPSDAASHIDQLVERVEVVLHELAEL